MAESETQVVCTIRMEVEVAVALIAEFAVKEEVWRWLDSEENQKRVAAAILDRKSFGESIGWLDDNREVLFKDIIEQDLVKLNVFTIDSSDG